MSKATHKAYAAEFEAAKDGLPGRGLPWLEALRARGLERFVEAGLPTIRDEAWKFTNLRALARDVYALAPARENGIAASDLGPWLPEGLDCHRLVFVNGRLRPDLSDIGDLPAGVRPPGGCFEPRTIFRGVGVGRPPAGGCSGTQTIAERSQTTDSHGR